MRTSALLSLFVCLACEFTVVAAPSEETTLYPIKRHARIGFIDRQGKVVIEPQFDLTLEAVSGTPSAGNLHAVARDGKWGYIDSLGVLRIPFQFSLAQQFSEGLAAVRVDTILDGHHASKYGYIDPSGALRIPAAFDEAKAFSEGLAQVVKNHKAGYIDKSGSFAIAPRFDMLDSGFSEGLAGVYEKGAADPQKSGPYDQDGLWGYIDKTGGWVLPPRYKERSPFHDGLAAVKEQGDSGYKYIDPSGQRVFGPFAMAGGFSDGLAEVHLMDGKHAFINREGKVQFTLSGTYHHVSPFADGLARVQNWVQPGGYARIGYIDRTGTLVIPQIYLAASDFYGGLASAVACNQSGYIGKHGEPVWGIKSRADSPRRNAAPSPSVIAPELIQKLTEHQDPVTLKVSPGSGTCDQDGNKIWSVEVISTDRTFPRLTINLLEGGTFLTEEKMSDIDAAREQLREKFPGRTKDVDVLLGRPIDPAGKLKGYVVTLGFGPGGSGTAASVFSPGEEYEVQVLLSRGESTRVTQDIFGLTSRIALETVALLFGSKQ